MKGLVVVLSDEKQSGIAKDLASQLRGFGFQTWDAEGNLLPGDNVGSETRRAMRKAQAVVGLIPTDPIDTNRCWYLADNLASSARLSKPTMKIVIGYGQIAQPPLLIDEIVGWLNSQL